ncbi:regulatory GntR family protein [Micromonospora sp. Llam0]|uniref:winged helix-turn-helix domain-containing protein n=1 Tax=Micromonospora sp. Llam0 TaxID=2485143 RepID=UPI000F4AEA9B|nr:winged helix-turn-helix domain-containing protein [Micromonospora sp. Llam0]ROO61836.1 regulatory GntR family protein [Micromonospora sp. Llam0]
MTVTPQWQQVADEIRAQVEAGQLWPGDRLPPTHQLREQYRVATSVVRQAILALEAEGVVRGVPGVGVFVADHDEGTAIVVNPAV